MNKKSITLLGLLVLIGMAVVYQEIREEKVQKEIQVEAIQEDKIQEAIVEEVLTYENLTRVNEEGPVTTKVTFINPMADDKDNWLFDIVLDTHSINLDDFDFSRLIEIEVDGEAIQQEALEFQVEGEGHHMALQVSLPKELNGDKIITSTTEKLAIYISEIGDVPLRTYVWEMDAFDLEVRE